MVNIQKVIEFLHPTAIPLVDYTIFSQLQNGVWVESITQWNEATLGVQPTQEQLLQVSESPAFIEWANNLIAQKRKELINKMLDAAEPTEMLFRGLFHLIFLVANNQRSRETTLLNRLTTLGINHNIAVQPAETKAEMKTRLFKWISDQLDLELKSSDLQIIDIL